MKLKIIIIFFLLGSHAVLRAQLPDSSVIRALGIEEIQSWVRVFKYENKTDSQLFEIKKYDTLGNELYHWQNLGVYGWGLKQEVRRQFEGRSVTEEELWQNGERESLTKFYYNPHGDLIKTEEIYFKYNDTIETHNLWYYNLMGKPDSMKAMRVGNYKADTAWFTTYYSYDTLGREVSVKSKNHKGVWLNETVNTWNADGNISEYSEEIFGEEYSYRKYYYDFYANGMLAGYTDDNNNRYEYYYDYRGLMYYMLYVDRLGDPNAGYYYFYTFRENE